MKTNFIIILLSIASLNAFSQKQNNNFKNEWGIGFGNTVCQNTLKYYDSPCISGFLMLYYHRQIFGDSTASLFLQIGCIGTSTNVEVDNINGNILRAKEGYSNIPIGFGGYAPLNKYVVTEVGLGVNFAVLNKQQFELPPSISLPDKYNKSNKFGAFIKSGVNCDLALRFSNGTHSKSYGKIGYIFIVDVGNVYKTKNVIPYYYKNYGLYISFGTRF